MKTRALYAVRSSPKDSAYPKKPVDFISSLSREEAIAAWKNKHPNHTIWTFDFVKYV